MWNVPTSEIQNLRNVKIKNRGKGKAGKRMDRNREKSSKNRGKRGKDEQSETKRKPIKHL